MTQMRELEQIHNEKLQDIAVSTLEKIMKNELPDDLPDDVRMVSGYFQRVCDILQFPIILSALHVVENGSISRKLRFLAERFLHVSQIVRV